MDIKEIIEKIVEEIKTNENLKEDFEKEPVKLIEKIVGVDLPDELVEKVIDGVKAKIAVDKVVDIAEKMKKLF